MRASDVIATAGEAPILVPAALVPGAAAAFHPSLGIPAGPEDEEEDYEDDEEEDEDEEYDEEDEEEEDEDYDEEEGEEGDDRP